MKFRNGASDEKVRLSTGTIVKLYDYNLESNASFRYIREALNENLVSTVLPFRLMDYRYRPDPRRGGRRALGVDERPLNGMEFLLLRRDGEEDSGEAGAYQPGSEQFIGDIEHADLGHVSVRAIVLDRELPGWLKSPRNTSRVFHAVNGQVKFKHNRAYLSQSYRLPGLKDRIVVIVDSSGLSEAAHNDVWKGDCENIRRTVVGKLYLQEVTALMRNSEYLRELQQRFAKEETERIANESQVELFQNLVDTDPSIAQLVPGGTLISLPGYIGRDSGYDEEWQGIYSPTFLELVGRSIKKTGPRLRLKVGGEWRSKRMPSMTICHDLKTGDASSQVGLDGKFSYCQLHLGMGDSPSTLHRSPIESRWATRFAFSLSLCLTMLCQSPSQKI